LRIHFRLLARLEFPFRHPKAVDEQETVISGSAFGIGLLNAQPMLARRQPHLPCINPVGDDESPQLFAVQRGNLKGHFLPRLPIKSPSERSVLPKLADEEVVVASLRDGDLVFQKGRLGVFARDANPTPFGKDGGFLRV
jgi:hypothetical protein